MPRAFSIALLALVLAACQAPEAGPAEPAAPPAAPTADVAADRAAIEALTASYQAAQRAGDHAAIAALHTDDAIVHPAGEPSAQGRAGLDAYFAATSAEPQEITFTTKDIVVAGSGEVAYEVGTMAGPGGEGKYLTVYRRTPEGWKIAADAWSMDASPPASN